MMFSSPSNKKKKDVKRFDNTDEKIAKYLISLGCKNFTARILAYLLRIKSAETIDLKKSGIFRKGALKKDYGLDYLFSWDSIKGKKDIKKEYQRLKDFLKDDYGFNWVYNAKIEKIDDGKTIRVFDDKRSILIKINKNGIKVLIDGKNAKPKSGKLIKFFAIKEKDLLIIKKKRIFKKQFPICFSLKKLEKRILKKGILIEDILKKPPWIKIEQCWDNPNEPKDKEDPGFYKYTLIVSFGDIINYFKNRENDKKALINRLLKKTDNEGIAEALKLLGLRKNIAQTMAFLKTVNEATSYDIIKNTRLFHSEISLVMKELKLRHPDWINVRNEIHGKGRPYKLYSLKVKFNDIIKNLKKEDDKAPHILELLKLSKKRRYL